MTHDTSIDVQLEKLLRSTDLSTNSFSLRELRSMYFSSDRTRQQEGRQKEKKAVITHTFSVYFVSVPKSNTQPTEEVESDRWRLRQFFLRRYVRQRRGAFTPKRKLVTLDASFDDWRDPSQVTRCGMLAGVTEIF